MWDAKKALLLSGVGIGIAASTAILYVLYKKDITEELKKSNNIITSRQAVIRVEVPGEVVGSIIGRQGAKIKEIQATTHTRINFEEHGVGEDSKRIAVIRGSPEEAQEAENIINSLILNQPTILTEETYVPQRACGRIIGKNGDTIRYLCQVSRAKIVIDKGGSSNNPEGLRRITISGTREEIDCAKMLIDEKVAEEVAYQQKVEFSSAGKVTRYKGRRMSAEGEKKNEMDCDDNKMQETLMPTANDGFIETYVSSVDTPSRFWVQLVGTKSIQLDRLVEDMTNFYNVAATRELLRPSNLSVGTVVAAPFTLDDAWYRARIISIEDNASSEEDSRVTVYYVDFGDEGQVLYKDVCVLSPEYMVIPFQAIECCLANVQPIQSKWSNEATELFSQLTYTAQWKVLMCRPVSSVKEPANNGTVYHVDLVDTNGTHDVNIAEQLVKKGFALWERSKFKKDSFK